MSEPPVNKHLAGILSDFEALKRSFDSEDDVLSFTSASPTSASISPSSCHFFLGHNKEREEHTGSDQPPSFSFNNSVDSVAHSHVCLSSSLSPVLKTRAVGSSLSFNRGTMTRPVFHNNVSSVTRAVSFQSKLNPNVCSSLLSPGSDNDSLHSSTSSLEYSSVGGYSLPATKLTSYYSPLHQREYQEAQCQRPSQVEPTIKFSFHGGVSKSEINPDHDMVLDIREVRGDSLSIPAEKEAKVEMPRGVGEDRISPGIMYVDANDSWNGLRIVNAVGGKKVPQKVFKTPKPGAKEVPRLNKFPLDLDSLVGRTSTNSPTKPEAGCLTQESPKHPSHSSSGLQPLIHSPPSTVSISTALSRMDRSPDTPDLPFSPSYPCPPVPSHSSISIPEMHRSSVPISPAENFQLDHLSGPEGFYVVSSSSSASSPKLMESLEEGTCDARVSMDLILQKIASFSWSNGTKTPAVKTPNNIQGADVSSSVFRSPTEKTAVTAWKEKKRRGEPAGRLQTDPFIPMEESEEKERGIMGEEQDDGGKNLGHEKIQTFESEENCMEGCTEEEEKEKGMETGKDAELEAEVKAELRPSDSDSQTSFIRGSDLFGYVGIEDVLDQMRRKTMKAGFEFNIMVVGQSGLGKSTLVNTLFKSKVSRKSCSSNYEEKITKTVKLHSISHVIEEKGVKMKLTVIDTPGFGDQINNENCWEPIVKYVNEQYERYLREELNINRKRRIPDSRVHCCIYFLPATGHRLRPLDVEFMKRLGKVVSIVPVIAKADTLTVDERQEFKERIKQDLAANGIHIYPQREYDEDTEERVLNDRIRESLPFAVVGTDKEHQVNGNKVLGRKTKWGIIEVENLAHCEFANLRDLLIRSHLQDLKDVAHDIHYEAYRVRRLNESNMNFSELVLSTWPLENGTDTCGTESLL
nr:uncharacterized protein septin12 isoform X2 [Nothobranchius furzeri]